jgi:predicted RNA-binding protein YlqC (UPF0109 family)
MTKEQIGEVVSQLVHEMVHALVDEHDNVKIHTCTSDGCVIVNVTVAKSDIGKVIGKQGRTARSMRTILQAASMKLKVRCELNIVDCNDREGKGAA